MNKMKVIIMTVVGVIISYLFMIVIMPLLTDMASTANTTMGTSSNMSNYFGTQEAMISAPWFLWFVPASIGIFIIVITLRQP